MAHTATIKTNLTRAEGEDIVVSIVYSDKFEQELIFKSDLTDEAILSEAQETAKKRVDELNLAEELAQQIRNRIEITIT